MIGSRIKSLRQQKGISQLSFSKQLNISNTTLSQYENDKRIPSLDILTNIADLLDVSLDTILGRENDTIDFHFENYLKDIVDTANSIDIEKANILLKDRTPSDWNDFYKLFKQLDDVYYELEKIEELQSKLEKIYNDFKGQRK